ncbi:MAG: glutaredoxin family protein [Chloroflexi bacterium]|nr:glutaredoxin family protein [Chloroflexota bacterium]
MKEFLSQKGIEFTDKDVIEDPAAMEELTRLKVFTTPVTTIDGEVVIGFDKERLESLLAE